MSTHQNLSRLGVSRRRQDAPCVVTGLKAGNLNLPVASEVQLARSAQPCSGGGRQVSFNRACQKRQNPAAAMLTPATAQNAQYAGLRAGIRRALDVSRLPNSGFVARQIAIHQEYQSRQTQKLSTAARLETALSRLDELAQSENWSHRKLASKIGLHESTLRAIRRGDFAPTNWLPKLESAVDRLSPIISSPSPQPEVLA